MVRAGSRYCVMEVSSHALALGRTDHCVFETAVFTNLAEDHLDFHKDQAGLFPGKAPAVYRARPKPGPRSSTTTTLLPAEIAGAVTAKVLTYGQSEAAAIRPDGRDRHGLTGPCIHRANAPGRCPGDFARWSGSTTWPTSWPPSARRCPWDSTSQTIARGIAAMRAVPGRMEKVDEGQALRRGRRLCPYRRVAGPVAGGGARDRPGAGDHGVRLRRGPRPDQAPKDGRRSACGKRPGHCDDRQPADRRPGEHHQRNRERHDGGKQSCSRPPRLHRRMPAANPI